MLPFRIYICALAALQRQGEPQEPRVLLHSTGSLQLEVIADLNLGLLKEVICDLKTQAHATQNGSQVPASSEEILGRVHRKEVDSRVTVSLVLRVPWTVRARLVVPAPRRLRKATKIFLEGIPPLNTEKSKGSVGSPAHHPQVSGHARAACGKRSSWFSLLQPSPCCPSSAGPVALVQSLTPASHLQGGFLQHGLYLSVFLPYSSRSPVAVPPCPALDGAARQLQAGCGIQLWADLRSIPWQQLGLQEKGKPSQESAFNRFPTFLCCPISATEPRIIALL